MPISWYTVKFEHLPKMIIYGANDEEDARQRAIEEVSYLPPIIRDNAGPITSIEYHEAKEA